MGLLMSRYFNRKRTPMEILEELEEEIQSIEMNRKSTLERQNKIIKTLILFSFILFTIFCAMMYLFFPSSTKDRLMFISLFALYPFSVFVLKWIISWYYMRQVVTCKERLGNLKAKKKQILEDVKKNESYNVASEILEKFAPEQLKKKHSEVPPNAIVDLNSTASKLGIPVPSAGANKPLMTPKQIPPSGMHPPSRGSEFPQGMTLRRVGSQGNPSLQTPRLSSTDVSPMIRRNIDHRQFIRPVLDPNRGVFDKLLEAIIGDGPNRRYALICLNCKTHNGMALEEDFKDIAYRCVYCGFFNPAKKAKPKADSPGPQNSTYAEQVMTVHRKVVQQGVPVQQVVQWQYQRQPLDNLGRVESEDREIKKIEGPPTQEALPPNEESQNTNDIVEPEKSTPMEVDGPSEDNKQEAEQEEVKNDETSDKEKTQ